MPSDIIFEMEAADLFLPLDNKFYMAGKVAVYSQQCIESKQAVDQMTFIVADASPEQLAFTQSGLERRAFPQFQGFGWLYIVMIVKEQGLVSSTARQLGFTFGVNNRGAFGLMDLDGKTSPGEHLFHETGAFC